MTLASATAPLHVDGRQAATGGRTSTKAGGSWPLATSATLLCRLPADRRPNGPRGGAKATIAVECSWPRLTNLAGALTRPSRSPATSGFAQSRSAQLVLVAPAPLRAPPHTEQIFASASPPVRSTVLLEKRATARAERHQQAVACLPLSSETSCPPKE